MGSVVRRVARHGVRKWSGRRGHPGPSFPGPFLHGGSRSFVPSFLDAAPYVGGPELVASPGLLPVGLGLLLRLLRRNGGRRG